VSGHCRHLDFLNLMTYDLKGSWDANLGLQSALYPGAADSDADKMLTVVSSFYIYVFLFSQSMATLDELMTSGNALACCTFLNFRTKTFYIFRALLSSTGFQVDFRLLR